MPFPIFDRAARPSIFSPAFSIPRSGRSGGGINCGFSVRAAGRIINVLILRAAFTMTVLRIASKIEALKLTASRSRRPLLIGNSGGMGVFRGKFTVCEAVKMLGKLFEGVNLPIS